MKDGWIKLHRKTTEWEWYNDNNVFRVFMHLLLTANYEDKAWRGIVVKRGEVVISIEKLSTNVRLSNQQTRTALLKLKSTNEITIKTTPHYTLIKLNNYEKHQQINKQNNNQITNEQQTTQQTSNKQVNKQNNKDYNAERKEKACIGNKQNNKRGYSKTTNNLTTTKEVKNKEELQGGKNYFLFRKLMKWLETLEHIKNPQAYAEKIFTKYETRIIEKALNDNSCISTLNFFNLIDYHQKKLERK